MQTLLFNTPRRVLGATLTALLVAASTLVSAPAALAAPAPDASVDTVLVPRITKGSHGVSMRVKRDSPQAKRYFASLARAAAPRRALRRQKVATALAPSAPKPSPATT